MGAAPHSTVLLETSPANIGGVLNALEYASDCFPGIALMAVAERGMERYEWLLRQAGAVAFATQTRAACQLASIAIRHQALQPIDEPANGLRLPVKLPWSGGSYGKL